ncbi:MAG: DMT family transporter [Xenococcaceae cyanobacterium MO_188.B32]|nr:DMT family transporter [Xenococcaceae cyanobacterium MO_188.B32]
MFSFYISKSFGLSWLQKKLIGIQQLNSTGIGLVSIFLALLFLSFTAIFLKLGETEISPNAIIFNRLWIATLILGLSQETSKLGQSSSNYINKKIDEGNLATYTNRERWLLLLVVVSSTASVVFWAWSLTQTSVANSTVLRNLTPLFTSLCGWLIFNQKFDRQFCWGMLIAIVGAIAIGSNDLQVSSDNFLGDATALFSALLYAIYLLASEQLRLYKSTTTILFWRCALGTLLVLPVAWLTDGSLFPSSYLGWLVVIALAVVCQVCGQGLLIYSLDRFSSSFVALFLLLTPINTAILAWLIFAESLSWLNAIAFVLVLFGIYLSQSSSSVQKSN